MENANNSFTVVAPQEGPSISVVGDTYRIIICSEQTDGAYALIDMLIPPKGGPLPHSHVTFQEAFYIIEGEITVITKKKTHTATKGSYVNIPIIAFKFATYPNANKGYDMVMDDLDKIHEDGQATMLVDVSRSPQSPD